MALPLYETVNNETSINHAKHFKIYTQVIIILELYPLSQATNLAG